VGFFSITFLILNHNLLQAMSSHLGKYEDQTMAFGYAVATVSVNTLYYIFSFNSD